MKFDYDAQYFNPTHTLECGQVFRFVPFKEGYKVFSADKAAYIHSDGVKTVVESDNAQYFWNYFDLDRDYAPIVRSATAHGIPLLTKSAEAYKGLRLLNADREEMLYSFIISQNNNIPRIKKIIENICTALGEKRCSEWGEYFAFPTTAALAAADKTLFKEAGAGYRDAYLADTSRRLLTEGIDGLDCLDTETLRGELLKYNGVGPKVADCILLFGFKRTDSFPVDTWIEKVYREDFGGALSDRRRIAQFFLHTFGEYSGYVQQYLFYGKRLGEKL